jgi:perosamine synthetase
MKFIPRRKVEFSWLEMRAIFDWVFSGRSANKIIEFEQSFAEYIGVPFAQTVPSARMGFNAIIDTLGLNPGDEVILSAYNYHVMAYLLAHKGIDLVFVDIHPKTYNINPDLIEEKITSRTKAILVTHLFGLSAGMQTIKDICERHHLFLIEDVAHSCGAEVEGRKLGRFGDFALFSFGTGKGLLALSGGMIVARDHIFFQRFQRNLQAMLASYPLKRGVCHFIKVAGQIVFTTRLFFLLCVYPVLLLLDMFRYDFIEKMTGEKFCAADISRKRKVVLFSEIQAVVGLVQLSRLDLMNSRRIEHAQLYDEWLKDIPEIQTSTIQDQRRHVYLCYTVATDQVAPLRTYLLHRGIDTKTTVMLNCAALLKQDNRFPQAQKIEGRLLELPCGPSLAVPDVVYIANCIRAYFGKSKMLPSRACGQSLRSTDD